MNIVGYKSPFKKKASPLKNPLALAQIGLAVAPGLISAAGSLYGRKARKKEQKKARQEFKDAKKAFESIEYVKFWNRMLKEIPNLYIYGYTRSYDAHLIDVGKEILKMNKIFKERFRIRFSNDLSKEFSANSADITSKGITCLAQLKASVSCSTCTLCWASNKPIRFLTH